MAGRIRHISKLVILVSVITVLFLPACGPPQSPAVPASSDNKVGENLPPIGDLDRGNPKLQGVLVRLIEAEKRGEAESFARQRVIQLRDGNVFVTIWVVPGQAEIAAKAATEAGATIESSYKNQKGFDAFVPITRLNALANEKSIYRIEVADPGQPGG